MTVLEYFSGRIETKGGKKTRALVDGVYFSLRAGETLALIGETGSGKTMTARSIMNLLPDDVATDGTRIEFCGRDVTDRTRKLLGTEIVYVPQSGHECLNPSKNVKGQMFDGLKKAGIKRSERYGVAVGNLLAVGFDNPEIILKKYPFELSGGMAQRVVIAMALSANAKLVICDEPTNGIDDEGKTDALKLIKSLFSSAGKIVVTHDFSVAEKSDKIAVLCKGKMMETGKTETVINAPKTPYAKALINALVKNGMAETPRLREAEGGCPYYARCAEANEKCLDKIDYRETDGVKFRCLKY